MNSDEEAKAARAELGEDRTMTVHFYGLAAVVRALVNAHPDPSRVRTLYDQLEVQMMASPAMATDKAARTVLKDFSASVFQPPVVLDT